MANVTKCTFCGNPKREEEVFRGGISGVICKNCLLVCYNEIQNSKNTCEKQLLENTHEKKLLKKIKPHLIKKELDKYVIGQEEAKKILSVAVYNHYKKNNANPNLDIDIKKSNVLLQGPTGTGKTYLMEILAKILNVPLAIVDANIFTEAGYRGEDVEFIIEKLLNITDWDIEKAEKGIVYIDEIDKISKNSFDEDRGDVSREAVQQALLRMLEGEEVSINPTVSFFGEEKTTVDTSKILFVAGGAFVGINKIIEERNPQNKKTIGFNTTEKIVSNNYNDELTHGDLIKYGLTPEFVGRFPVLITLEELGKKDLKDILIKPKNSIIKQYEALFKLDGVDLRFADDAIDYIVDEAITKKIGARGLRSIIEKCMYKIMYDIPQTNMKKVVITKDMLLGKGIKINKNKAISQL